MRIEQTSTKESAGVAEVRDRSLVRDGFLAMLPLWTGAIPTGVAFAIAAADAGLSVGETVLMSLIVFSAAAQLAAVALGPEGNSVASLALITFVLNVQLVLLGFVTGRAQSLSAIRRPLVAFFLTDGAFGIAARWARIHWQVVLGAGVSMYLGWNLGTLLGALAGATIPSTRELGLVAPLCFIAVLAPLIRSGAALVTLLVAGATTVALAHLPAGATILAAALVGSVAGSWWAHRGERGEQSP